MRFYPVLLLAFGLAAVVALAVLLSLSPRPTSLPQQGPEGVWLFDFGPDAAAPFPGFARVSGRTEYEGTRGYGWIGVEGKLESGTFHKASLHWEGASNLNLILRPGPDALAAGFATGNAVFALDLPAGRYDVWVLTGDWGLLEYIPHEAYQILVEDSLVGVPGKSQEEFYRHFEVPGPDDIISDSEAYERYVAPRFRWEKVTTSVDDGQLTVQVRAPERPKSILEKLGYYPVSDIRQGPPQRFAGALNAMVVTPSDPRSKDRIEQIDAVRREHFQDRHPRIPPPGGSPKLAPAEVERGYSLFSTTSLDAIMPDSIRDHEELAASLRATPGEYALITFAIRPHRDLGEVSVVTTGLTSESGARIISADIGIGAVRHVARRSGSRKEPTWAPTPRFIVPGNRQILTPHVTKQFWLTLHVPEDATPGTYTGAVDILPERGAPARLELELEVLPFRLLRPTHIATGVTYFVPIAYAYYDEDLFWRRIRADFDDMRRHNMTTVQLTGVGLENHDDLGRLFGIYRDAGFERPIYLLEAYSAIERVTGVYGYAEDTEPFYERYVAIFAELLEQARRRSWPPLIVNFGDEFTNKAREEFGAELAKRLRRLPGIVTAVDANGYKEVALLAPHVSIVAFNRGWSGPTRVNGDKRLLKAETVALIKKAGATPWLVNLGGGRFSNGPYLWKMMRLGVRGKLEWIYADYRVEPHNPFDGSGDPTRSFALAGPSNTVLPTVGYERMRQGLDDLAYLYTLEELAKTAPRGAERARAKALIERVDRMIDDDFEIYRASKADRWSAEDYRNVRDDLTEAILSLQ